MGRKPAHLEPEDGSQLGGDFTFTAPENNFPELHLPRILSVALHHFATRGYHATSVRDIARDVGCTVPALYYHYKNKQDILVSLLKITMDILEHVVHSADDPDAPVDQRLSEMTRALVLYSITYSDLAFLDTDRRALDPENFDKYRERRDVVEHLFREVVLQGCDETVFATANPIEATRAILASCLGIGTWFRDDGPSTPEEMADKYAAISLATVEFKSG